MRITWTDDMVDFLRKNYPYYTNDELVGMMKEKFGVTVTRAKLKNAKATYNFKNKAFRNKGCFQKGMTPWNKGRTMSEETREKVKRTWFKKGNVAVNTKPLGSTRINADGYKVIKLTRSGKWKLYSRYMYEKYHEVELTSDDVIIFADRNPKNFEKDNLIKVNRRELLYLNQRGLIFENKDLTKSGVVISKVEIAIDERRKERK